MSDSGAPWFTGPVSGHRGRRQDEPGGGAESSALAESRERAGASMFGTSLSIRLYRDSPRRGYHPLTPKHQAGNMNHKYFAVSARGIESVTAAELERLGGLEVRPVSGGVHFEGDMRLLYRAGLWLRTASRILRPLREFAAQNAAMLYSQARRVRWEDYLDPSKTLAVHATIEGAASRAEKAKAQSPERRGGPPRRSFARRPAPEGLDHTMFAALKIKDAIVDRLRREQGARPNVDKERPDVLVHAHFARGRCTLSLDATGPSLHERGYRTKTTSAPLKETLAAAIVELTGWDGRVPFFDPMCGSGTLVIEAAMKALQMAPGLARPTFGFQRWPEFDGKAWQEVVAEAREKQLAAPPSEFIATDRDSAAVDAARENARQAGVDKFIRFDVQQFGAMQPPTLEPGFLVTNPPYGARLGEESELQALYQEMSGVLQTRYGGWQVFIMAGNLGLARHITLPATQKIKLNNGPLEFRLLKFEPGPNESRQSSTSDLSGNNAGLPGI
jgi:putative N6-adenine-specific DNA methylase